MSKRIRVPPFVLVFASLYGALSFYVGLRGWQWLQSIAPAVSGWAYWLPFGLVASAFLVARLARHYLPQAVVNLLTLVGAYWLPFLVYSWLVLGLIDLLHLLNRLFGLIAPLPAQFTQIGGGAVVLLLVGMVLVGAWQSWRPHIRRYEVTIAKGAGAHQHLHIVLASDLHAGATHGLARVRQLVGLVNPLKPDLILLAGDIVDDNPHTFVARQMDRALSQLQSRLGTYAVAGNHDDQGGDRAEFARIIQSAGIRLLRDERMEVDGSFYLIGREDLSARYYAGRPRKSLLELTEGLDRSRPLILMDHQPLRLEEAVAAGIDLQVSGHTHRGQLWPFHLITRRIFELDWGYLKKVHTHIFVSLGFGTWGPPVRLGNRTGIMSIRVRFEAVTNSGQLE